MNDTQSFFNILYGDHGLFHFVWYVIEIFCLFNNFWDNGILELVISFIHLFRYISLSDYPT